MNSVLHWKKSIFSKTCTIHSADGEIGQLTENSWKQSAEGVVNNRRYSYRTRGFFNQVTEIVDPSTAYPVGKIEYNTLKNKATLTYLDHTFYWHYDNLLQSRWSITDEQGLNISFQGNLQKGSIEGEDLNEFLILSGLFVTNYYVQSTIVILVAIFVPIIATQTR